jgi:hypothetical protein
MESPDNIKCQIDTSIHEPCPPSCKLVLKDNNSLSPGGKNSCIAKAKMNAFLEGNTTFNVGITAFYQSSPVILNEFIEERPENLELVSYFLSISEPERVADIIESLSESVIYKLFKDSYINYQKLRDNYRTKTRKKSFFQIKGNRFWQGMSFQKVCKIIAYTIREKQEHELASQLIALLPIGVVPRLQEFSGINNEEEKNLYLGLGDSIYELPIQSPGIYPHMRKLFSDDMEISIILGTMEELVKRQERILSITHKLIDYYEGHSFGLTIQNIYSELSGLETEMISEILNQLKEKNVVSDSQRDMLNLVFQRGSIDFLKSLKEDILRS